MYGFVIYDKSIHKNSLVCVGPSILSHHSEYKDNILDLSKLDIIKPYKIYAELLKYVNNVLTKEKYKIQTSEHSTNLLIVAIIFHMYNNAIYLDFYNYNCKMDIYPSLYQM
jgi:hypothetical protein